MRSKNYREENSEPGRYNEEALDYKLGIREQPPDKAAILFGQLKVSSVSSGYTL